MQQLAEPPISNHIRLRCQRVLGSYHFGEPGPVMVAVGGVHGNEPGGVMAIMDLLRELRLNRPKMRGHFIGLSGNRKALEKGVRYLEEDLNRMWRAAAQRTGQRLESPEYEEYEDLNRTFGEIEAKYQRQIAVLDLHSFSAEGSPFAIVGDSPANFQLANDLPVTAVMGLDGKIQGTLSRYLQLQGHRAIVFEGGQHYAPRTRDNLTALLCIMLEHNGLLKEEDLPMSLRACKQRLQHQNQGKPNRVRVTYRHRIESHDQFVMNPGFENFDPITAGQNLAQDRLGPVLSPQSGRILMPLYQGQGQDGFFLTTEES